jgi:hypothetical protein
MLLGSPTFRRDYERLVLLGPGDGPIATNEGTAAFAMPDAFNAGCRHPLCLRTVVVAKARVNRRCFMKIEQRNELLQQMLETELGGVLVYETALQCVLNEQLKEEWEKYLEQTKTHVRVVQDLMEALQVMPQETPGRLVVRHIGHSLVDAIKMARAGAPPPAAEIVACECVVHAETKDHANWELLTAYGEAVKGEEKEAIDAALAEVEDEEDEHLYHSKGWCRELSIASLGLKAVFPPPEEQKDVKTAIGAARAKQARTELM